MHNEFYFIVQACGRQSRGCDKLAGSADKLVVQAMSV